MKTIIVDDDPVFSKILKHLIQKSDHLILEKVFDSAEEAYKYLEGHRVQVMFLDIELPDLNGIELLESLNNKPYVVIISSHEEYAFDAYQLDVVDYITKPVRKPRFLKAEQKLLQIAENDSSTVNNSIFVKKGNFYHKIKIEDILWLQSDQDYVVIVSGKDRFYLKSTMSEILKTIGMNFIRVHRSYIVNLNKIDVFDDSESLVYIANIELPVGKTYRKDFKTKLKLHS